MLIKTFIVTMFLLSLSSSCVQSRLEKRLAGHTQKQSLALKAFRHSLARMDREKLSWEDATRLLEQQNLTLKRARDQVENVKKQRKDQWLTLIPKIQGFAGLSQNLTRLASLSSDDINARVLASFSIPNPVRFYGQFYAIALQSLQAEWSYELTRRQQYARLYTIFLQESLLSEKYQILLHKEQLLEKLSLEEIASNVASLTQEKRDIEEQRDSQRLAVNRLLNTPRSHWQPFGAIPNISYRKKYKNLQLGEGFGKLALKLQTLQIESSVLRILNVKLQQLPSISIGVSSAVLFTNNESNQPRISADDFYLFSGLSKTVDLIDVTGRENLRMARVRAGYTRDQLELSMEGEMYRLNQLKTSYSRLQTEKRKLRLRMNYLKNKEGSSQLESLFSEYKEHEELQGKTQRLDSQLVRMDIQFWIWDETYWAKN